MDIREVRKIKIKSLDKFIEEKKLEEILPNILYCNFKNLKEIVNDNVSLLSKNNLGYIFFLKEDFNKWKKEFENSSYTFYKKEDNYFFAGKYKNSDFHFHFYFYCDKKEFIKNYFLGEYKISGKNVIVTKDLEELNNNFRKFGKFNIEKYKYKDNHRFNNQVYESEIYDINKGSWDIFEDLDENGNICDYKGEEFETEELEKEVYARNPKYDIVESGVIGIDFGTKSTVVVSYRDDNAGINESKTLPIRISGDMRDIERTENYENATIIHFDNLENFIKEYNLTKGRPYTHYCDVQISLEAENKLNQNSENFDLNEFMLDLKQWASSKHKKKKIRDKRGDLHTINGYLDMTEEEIDPIEIYAYYIGCRINNMAQYSIFLEYYLSFPVTYELEVKNRILNSFRKGLMKSLPISILEDEEIMKKFRVTFGASEPASYAITALKKFCVEPDLDNEIGYSVFDFGGGTTDFSYGIYREKENSRKYDYEIQELESGGDKYLGGENLLALVAFDVFLQNKEKIVQGQYFISLPENKKFEIGFETFVSESSEAEYNMKRMMEALRNYWEGKLEETEKDKLKITVYLANKLGQYQNEELDVDYDRLDEILRKNIYGGIVSFLEKLNKVFKDKNLREIYIFLAGNSSKSKFVEEIFENELTEEFRQKYNIILKNAYSIEQEIDGEVIGLNSKTGVAFGLVELREGNGEVEYIPFRNTTKNEEINFKYCLGYSKKRRFIPVINFNTKYNEWIKYDEIENEKIIEVLYSGNTRAEGKEFPASECSRIRILIQNDERGALYIRLKNPNTIEYVICEDINSFDEGEIIEKELQ